MANIFGIQLGSKFKSTKKIEAERSSLQSDYERFNILAASDKLQRFQELDPLVHSGEFQKKVREYKRKEYKQSEEYHQIKEHKALSKDKDLKWYQATKRNYPFKELEKWELTFEDDFDSARLDSSKWMTSYYWGKALMNDSYVLAGDKQNFNDDNIELRDSMARIHLRKEESKGKVWDTTHGFLIHPFAYSSGLISTSQSFRQKHGRFEAKIRFSSAWPLLHAFWMVGESMTPQIDIFKTSFRKNSLVECGLHTGEKEQKSSKMRKINGAKFAGNFFIYSLDWSPESLIWRINGKEVHRQTNNIPQESMYLTFSTTLPAEPKDKQVPGLMEIDWVRCYRKKD